MMSSTTARSSGRTRRAIVRILAIIEPFILALLATVVLASLVPAHGIGAAVTDHAATAGIVLLFFLHGAKLSRQAVIAAARDLKLHALVLGVTFVLFPLLGLALVASHLFRPAVAEGLLFLTLLPSTVQSSIAFTSIARGNVAAALCSASFSNLLGIVVTPLLVVALMGTHGAGAAISFGSAETIALQLLLPFVLGQLTSPWLRPSLDRGKRIVTLVDRGSVLLVVYASFSASVVAGLWTRLSAGDLIAILAASAVLLAIVLTATRLIGRSAALPRADAIVLVFCGSKKSLATGVPLAGALFPATQAGALLLPVMIFHQLQLIACAILARRYADDDRA